MKSFNFIEGKACNYDPYHVVSNLRVSISYTPYIHHANIEIERLENKESLPKVQEILQAQHVLLSVKKC